MKTVLKLKSKQQPAMVRIAKGISNNRPRTMSSGNVGQASRLLVILGWVTWK
eukprot:CAMPEP_0172831502 /NCGR_PEP_ID=MMETSP1075-20121228/23022_1 /TAXON_ID=2916 /ORGANISM="Ceratium fusus, Strain PA161109" /LENGTH=51 /DNA_ID=CAMNT_0013673979 /DNA_START=320 /DNA_END=472 /DNA_ORIENTATION=+